MEQWRCVPPPWFEANVLTWTQAEVLVNICFTDAFRWARVRITDTGVNVTVWTWENKEKKMNSTLS